MQLISSQPQELDDLHKIDLRGRHEEDWATFYKKHIEIWKHMYDYLSTREPFFTPELVTSSDYMDWFRNHGKPYLLSISEKSKQRRRRRPIQGPINPRSGRDAAERPTSAPHAYEDPVAIQPPCQYGSFILIANPFYFTPSP
ncbi:hypothetical protein F383_13165 [Gossypium arboreum]|uniref:Uncharacterized protein n=1 Tax=Gossypium arboreum TaxID=29729 RepID=A0A0B0NBN1_GOSAR|nr:hypothetical protein F383_13165 [Gossypium arboreum]